jgi:hypothetical protein
MLFSEAIGIYSGKSQETYVISIMRGKTNFLNLNAGGT